MDILFMQSAANCDLPELVKIVLFFSFSILKKIFEQCFPFLFSLLQLKEIIE